LVPRITFSLRYRGFQRTREALQKKPPPHALRETGKAKASEKIRKTCRMVKAAVRYGLVRPSCLAESLALWHLLQSQGISARLRIGVRKLPEKFEAHAWVEYEGAALDQTEALHRHYVAFDRGFPDLPGEES